MEVCLNTLVIWLVLKPNLVSRLPGEDYLHKAKKGPADVGLLLRSTPSIGSTRWDETTGHTLQLRLGARWHMCGEHTSEEKGGIRCRWGMPSSGGLRPPDFRCLMSRARTRPSPTSGTGYFCGSVHHSQPNPNTRGLFSTFWGALM